MQYNAGYQETFLSQETDTDRAYVAKLTDKVWERQEIGKRNQESGRASQQGRLVWLSVSLSGLLRTFATYFYDY